MTTARDIRRRFNNAQVATAIVTRAAEDFLLSFPNEKLNELRTELEKRSYFPYPLIRYPEIAVLCAADNTWTDRPLADAILMVFTKEFKQALAQAGLELSVKLGSRDAIGVYVVPSK